jgi:hypothetical protein
MREPLKNFETPHYKIHLQHMTGRTTLCGEDSQTLVGERRNDCEEWGFTVVASPISLQFWLDEHSSICLDCKGHEDYPLFVLGAV